MCALRATGKARPHVTLGVRSWGRPWPACFFVPRRGPEGAAAEGSRLGRSSKLPEGSSQQDASPSDLLVSVSTCDRKGASVFDNLHLLLNSLREESRL